jgi:hypothetical protein
MYDYSYLDARIVWDDDMGVCMQGNCMSCGRRFFVACQSKENALARVRQVYRNHKLSGSGSPCIAGVKSYSTKYTRQRKERDRARYAEQKNRR